ncbi:hypothetical protein [Derxia gummosa]|uniref:Uncharacterized protein n=1 Tax=Derxia gummosa DSM 723 TaxID=1121388 RepID=A0A8B6X4V8_9BURK|nr:hypothetical protein [Derxia gummosa]
MNPSRPPRSDADIAEDDPLDAPLPELELPPALARGERRLAGLARAAWRLLADVGGQGLRTLFFEQHGARLPTREGPVTTLLFVLAAYAAALRWVPEYGMGPGSFYAAFSLLVIAAASASRPQRFRVAAALCAGSVVLDLFAATLYALFAGQDWTVLNLTTAGWGMLAGVVAMRRIGRQRA